MKESISYTFLLNIIILFIFTCAAIIMGIFSYYKAFRANTIISETIEKYEGYNCLSKEEIARKLNNIGYNTPFKVNCKTSDGKCESNEELGYKVISYNLDFDGNLIFENEDMNSVYQCDSNGCATNKHYQYGIYTYMYVEMPVISNILRIPFFSKTSTMYEFRNYYIDKLRITETESLFDGLYSKNIINGLIYVTDNYVYEEEKSIDIIEPTTSETWNDATDTRTKIPTATAIGNRIQALYANESANISLSGDKQYQFLFNTYAKDMNLNYKVLAQALNIKTLNGNNSFDGRTTTRFWSGSRHNCGYKRIYGELN